MKLPNFKNINYLNLWKLAFLFSLGYIIYYSATESYKEKARTFIKGWEKDKIKLSTKGALKVKIKSNDKNKSYNLGVRIGYAVKKIIKNTKDYLFWFSILLFVFSVNKFVFQFFIKRFSNYNFENFIIYSILWILLFSIFDYWLFNLILGEFKKQIKFSKTFIFISCIISSSQFVIMIIRNWNKTKDDELNIIQEQRKYLPSAFIAKVLGNKFIKKHDIVIANILVFIIVVFTAFFLPSTTNQHEASLIENIPIFILFVAILIFFSIVFGVFHYKFIHRLAFRNKSGFGNLVLYCLLNLLAYTLLDTLFEQRLIGTELEKNHTYLTLFAFGVAFIFSFFRDYNHNRTIQEQLVIQRNQAELSTLKAQVNPHFLFNTLNNLYGTAIVEEADKTAAGIHQLAGIMRHVVEESKHESTPIEKEIKFLGDFIELNKIRLPNRENIKVTVNVKYDEKSFLIAPLLLIPFVENAFKYGISIKDDCFVVIDLNIVEDKIHFICRNSIIKNNNLEPSTGTGIDNVRKRLALNYPNKHTLDISTVGGVFEVRLELDLG